MQNLDPAQPTAADYVSALKAHQSSEELKKILDHFQTREGQYAEGDSFMGVRLGQVVELSRRFVDMEPAEIEKLLESPVHEVRAGALSIMDKQARRKTTSQARRHELFGLYIRRLDRINNWDLVDKGAPYVVGGYLADKPRDILYRLAGSRNLWQRRTAIVATSYFIREGDLDDTFEIARLLLDDDEPLIHKATGWMLREAGKRDRKRLQKFLDEHAAHMPRTMLRSAIEHLDEKKRERYMGLDRPASRTHQRSKPPTSKTREKTAGRPRKAPATKATKQAATGKRAAGAKKASGQSTAKKSRKSSQGSR